MTHAEHQQITYLQMHIHHALEHAVKRKQKYIEIQLQQALLIVNDLNNSAVNTAWFQRRIKNAEKIQNIAKQTEQLPATNDRGINTI